MIYQYKNLKIHYEPHLLDDSSKVFYPEFLRVIRERIGKVEVIHEAFAGTGLIGFSLLEDEMCNRLVLSDITDGAIEHCKKTIKENGLEDKTLIYQSNCLKQIPEQKWDLVVGNPPHFPVSQNLPGGDIISLDRDWNFHRSFYTNIGRYLKPESSILFVENGRGSSPEIFYDMIQEGGLRVVDTSKCEIGRPAKFYFMWVKKK